MLDLEIPRIIWEDNVVYGADEDFDGLINSLEEL